LTNKAKQYLKEAKALLADATERERSADSLKWDAVERIYRANVEEGASQADVAKAVGLGQQTISQYVRMWKEFGLTGIAVKPTFTEAQLQLFPGKSSEAQQMRAAKAVLSDPARAAQVIDTIEPAAKSNIVKHVAKSDKGAMTDAMQDPKARMRAEGASSRARDIARTEAKNERRAARGGSQTPDEGAAALFAIGNIMSDGAAWAGRLSDAWEQLLRVGTDDQVEAAKGRIATGAFPITKVIGDITGTGVDAALAQMLGDTEV
jgi:transposase-like protein